MTTTKETIKQIALNNFDLESVELVAFMFLMNEGTCRYEGNQTDNNVVNVLSDNGIAFDIREMMDGRKFIELH